LDLSAFGWDEAFEESFKEYKEKQLLPARVIEANRLFYRLISAKGEINGKLTDKFRENSRSKGDNPTVGDWVAYRPSEYGFVQIQGLVKRKSKFSRKVAGSALEEQVIAANIDTIFIVSGLDRDFNVRRLERYAVLAADSNAELVFLLNKADLRKDMEQVTAEIKKLFKDVPVYALSALNNNGLEQLAPYIQPGKTMVFIGSSGTGKSTLINLLLGEEKQKTGHVSPRDGRGRHITSSKNLLVLPNGAIVIDTPGLRELQLLGNDAGLKNTFSDIESLAANCEYKNCTHTKEPGCAVLAAVNAGTIPEERVKNYRKLKREIEYNLSRHEKQFKNKRSKKWMDIRKQKRAIERSEESQGDDYLDI
jgi:ribosome biogenesis GTPase / thiamine phosphate phosphatase